VLQGVHVSLFLVRLQARSQNFHSLSEALGK
jgi:hypothetical protein